MSLNTANACAKTVDFSAVEIVLYCHPTEGGDIFLSPPPEAEKLHFKDLFAPIINQML